MQSASEQLLKKRCEGEGDEWPIHLEVLIYAVQFCQPHCHLLSWFGDGALSGL